MRVLEHLENRVTPATFAAVALPASLATVGDMLLLDDGEVLIQQGTSRQWFRLTPGASGNYTDGTFSTAASMSIARQRFAANVLPDGQVVAIGGENTDVPGVSFTSSVDMYNPTANVWNALEDFPGSPNGRAGPSPTELIPGNSSAPGGQPDGQLLVGSFYRPDTYLLDPTQPGGHMPSLQWTATGPKVGGINYDTSREQSFIILPDKNVLAYDIARTEDEGTFSADQYTPSTGLWSDVSPAQPYTVPELSTLNNNTGADENGPPLLLPPNATFPSGAVFWLGENGNTAFFNLASNTWSAGLSLPTITVTLSNGTQVQEQRGAADAPAALMPNGHALLALSVGYLGTPTTLFDFDPNAPRDGNTPYTNLTPSSSSTPYPALNNLAADGTCMLDLPNGHVLFAAGNQLWEYTPDAGTPTQTPLIAGIGNLNNGAYDGQPNADGTYNLSGTYLTGFSEGAAQGDQYNGCATNYPIVKLTLGGRVWYATTTGWTPGVDDPTLRTVEFTLPGNLPVGTFSLQVVASGIGSDPVDFTNNTSPVYADAAWANLSPGTVIDVPDPLSPGGAPGILGDTYGGGANANCFGSVNAAITAAAQLGVPVVVNGSDGMGDGGAFDENVVVTRQVPLYLQRGTVMFGLLSSSPNDAGFAAAESVTVAAGSTLSVGDPQYYVDTSEYDGTLVGPGSLVEDGIFGTLALGGTDNLTGGITVNSGNVVFTGAASVTGLGGVTVNDGTLGPFTANALAAVTVTVSSAGSLNLYNVSAATFGGLAGSAAINLGTTTLTVGGDGDNTTYYGAVTGAEPLIKIGTGTLTFDSTGSTVPITVNGGSVQPSVTNALAGDTVTLNVGGNLDLSAVTNVTLGGLAGAVPISLGTNNATAKNLTVGANNSTTTFDGLLSGVGTFQKAGNGTLSLTATDGVTDTIAGATVSAGTLQVTGTLRVSTPAVLTVAAGAVLDGPGAVYATVNVAGTLSAANASGTGNLFTGILTLSSSGTPGALSALLAPTGYDQVTVYGLVDLSGASLSMVLAPGYTPNIGDQFQLIQNRSLDPTINHAFANLPSNGDVISTGGQYFAISGYNTHTITLTRLSPQPQGK